MQCRTQQVSGRNHSTVGNRIEEGLPPIPGSVESDCKPQIPGAPQSQAEEKTNESGEQNSIPAFAGILAMNQAKRAGKQQRRRPESDSPGKREL